jgi:glutamate dehydrogenase
VTKESRVISSIDNSCKENSSYEKSWEVFASCFRSHIDPEEAQALPASFLDEASRLLFETMMESRCGDSAIISAACKGRYLVAHCRSDGSHFLDTRINAHHISQLVVMVSRDIDYLVDTFTDTIETVANRQFVIHPILEIGESLAKFANVPLAREQRLSCVAIKLANPLPRAVMEQLMRNLATNHNQLELFNLHKEQLIEDFHSALSRNGIDPSRSAWSQFVPLLEVKQDGAASIGISGLEELHSWLLSNEQTSIGPVLVPYRTEIIEPSLLRCAVLKTGDGERVLFGGIFYPALLGTVGTGFEEIAKTVEEARKELKLLETSHSFRMIKDLTANLAADTVLSLPVPEFTELCRRALILDEAASTTAFVSQNGPISRLIVLIPEERVHRDLEAEVEMAISRRYPNLLGLLSRSFSERRMVLEFALLTEGRESLELALLIAELEEITKPWKKKIMTQLGDLASNSPEVLEALALIDQAVEESYKEEIPVRLAASDIALLAKLITSGERLGVSIPEPSAPTIHIIARGKRPTLSEMIPVLEAFGIKVTEEIPYRAATGTDELWLIMINTTLSRIDEDAATRLTDLLARIWTGIAEYDRLCSLALSAGLAEPEIALLRAVSGYLRLTELGYAETYIHQVFESQPKISALLVDLFKTRFDPDLDQASRNLHIDELAGQLEEQLELVPSLSEDKILRTARDLILATTRTNYFFEDIKCLAIKIDPAKMTQLPDPRPDREFYCRSSKTEAVHLRAGAIARGGIRYSDRREDFRTEILGLMKAQTVKNAIIVPTGAKGGFVVKRQNPDHLRVEQSYREFISALLDLTDNISKGQVIRHNRLVCYDPDDPYLVVAADKGTASFSDIANEIAIQHGYWLKDAFASGGSHGFDHKKMGITAKGAWISALHHLESLGINPDNTPVTVAGIGDLSGDVFGNAMIGSKAIKLVAAFDHRHIFLDPNPDPQISFAARMAVFAKGAGTSWADYPCDAISTGGGVFSRKLKQIELSPEAAQALGTAPGSFEPNDVIRAILSAPVDLIYNGGIGTYIKAASESNLDVGDKANDRVRVDAASVRAKVVVEGGNLGVTQRGRIEYCLLGGKCNTDSIDNSAGVDTSDHEVNIKIALDQLGQLDEQRRDQLLSSSEQLVELKVLADNVYQNWVLSSAETEGDGAWIQAARLLEHLIRSTGLDPRIEELPEPEKILNNPPNRPVTRAELAILISYAKIDLKNRLINSDICTHHALKRFASDYFPPNILELVKDPLESHPLKNQLVATQVANALVNHFGIFGTHSLAVSAEISLEQAATLAVSALSLSRADEAVRRLLWSTGPSFLQKIDGYLRIQRFLRNLSGSLRLVAPVENLLDAVARFEPADLDSLLTPLQAARVQSLGQPEEISTFDSTTNAYLQLVDRLRAFILAKLVLGPDLGNERAFVYATEVMNVSPIGPVKSLLADLRAKTTTEMVAIQQIADHLDRLEIQEIKGLEPDTKLLESLKSALARKDLLAGLVTVSKHGR